MTVTVYRYDDSGAPVLSSPSAGSLIGVLDACLVNGYGDKLPAGWTKAFAGTNLAAYRQGAGSMCYLRVNDATGTGQARVVGYESMTDISTGTNAFPTGAQLANGIYITINASAAVANKPWVLIADDKRFYLWTGFAAAMTAASLLSASALYQGMFFFGDIVSYKPGDAFCCQIIGAHANTTTAENFGNGSSALTATSTGHYISRDAAQSVGAVFNAKYCDYIGGGSQSVFAQNSGVGYPDPISGGISLSRILVTNGASVKGVRGRLPGCWAPLNALPGSNGDTVSGVGELAGREFILLDCGSGTYRGRVAIETSDTWE